MAAPPHDLAPGDDTLPGDVREEILSGLQAYLIGPALAVLLTATSFWAASTALLGAPGVPIGLAVLAIAQMGVDLVFLLRIMTAPDNTNNVPAPAFGVLIVAPVVGGSLRIMANPNRNMAPSPALLDLHLQRREGS